MESNLEREREREGVRWSTKITGKGQDEGKLESFSRTGIPASYNMLPYKNAVIRGYHLGIELMQCFNYRLNYRDNTRPGLSSSDWAVWGLMDEDQVQRCSPFCFDDGISRV